jgi:undecaprenyl-diphosphatase
LLIKAAVMGVVEGLTEFLPISSTGHLILAGSLLNFTGEAAKVFDVAIQSGAMLAVIWEYRERLLRTVPASRTTAGAALCAERAGGLHAGRGAGAAVRQAGQAHLFHPVPVALAFIVGGLIILWVEAWHRRRYGALDMAGTRRARVETVDDMRPMDALKVGLLQCLALIPGTSRSGATIIGAMVLGFSRVAPPSSASTWASPR